MGIFKRKGKLFSKLAIKTNMWNNRDKIIKKDGKKPTDLEEEVAKSIQKVENNNKGLKAYLSIIFINSVANVDYTQADGTLPSICSSESHTDHSWLSKRSDNLFKNTSKINMVSQLWLLPTEPSFHHQPSNTLPR